MRRSSRLAFFYGKLLQAPVHRNYYKLLQAPVHRNYYKLLQAPVHHNYKLGLCAVWLHFVHQTASEPGRFLIWMHFMHWVQR
ncbi:hypothetical protein J7E73_28805 [Paenibacillus albidus]|uniref:hypothetical protein n=1 Tax=Paenibacillus albidus TaxID=2041023 RepID=UPI001BE81EBD|nr:hypothetical protein [Paenibacillus albidus]MBT2293042.1 hypothetical protein [Paenibacillus albidus]